MFPGCLYIDITGNVLMKSLGTLVFINYEYVVLFQNRKLILSFSQIFMLNMTQKHYHVV